MPTIDELRMLQALPLDIKIAKTKARIREWVEYYGEDSVYVSFSGGKDSTVLLHIARQLYPNIEAVYVDTGLEYPEIKQFVKTFENVTILRPKMTFREVICKYGYPLISKEVAECIDYSKRHLAGGGLSTVLTTTNSWANYPQRVQMLIGGYPSKIYDFSKYKPLINVDFNISSKCCGVMKKSVAHSYNRKQHKVSMTAQMASESMLRQTQWLKSGCNGFNMKSPVSNPLSFWTNQDILQYIKEYGVPICVVYGEVVYIGKSGELYDNLLCDCGRKLCTTGCERTGCIFCGFGAHLENGQGRFQRLKQTHLKLYTYCLEGGEYNKEGIWQPNSKGLGMRHCFEVINNIYGKDFIKYE